MIREGRLKSERKEDQADTNSIGSDIAGIVRVLNIVAGPGHDEKSLGIEFGKIAARIVGDWLLLRFRNRSVPGRYEYDISEYWHSAVAKMVDMHAETERFLERQVPVAQLFLKLLFHRLKSNEAAEFRFTDGTYRAFGTTSNVTKEELLELLEKTKEVALVKQH